MLLNKVKNCNDDIRMEFWMEESATLVMQRERHGTTSGIDISDSKTIMELSTQDTYKCLGVLNVTQ